MKRLIVILSLLAALCSATVSSAAGNTDHVDAATSVLLVGSDGRAAIPTGAAGVTATVAQLPAAAALGDGVTLPTTTITGDVPLIYNGSTLDIPRNTAALGDGSASKQTAVGSYVFNGASWDRQYNNTPSVAVGITCAACTSTQTGADQTNFNGHGVRCTYDATIVTSVGSFTVEIDGKDEVSGKYIALLTGTARSTVGTDTLTVYPGIAASANVAASMVVPRTWRVKATFNSGTNQTFTIGCNTLV